MCPTDKHGALHFVIIHYIVLNNLESAVSSVPTSYIVKGSDEPWNKSGGLIVFISGGMRGK